MQKFDDIQVTDIVKITVADAPKIIIENVTYPKSVSYEDKIEIGFTLDKESIMNPKDINIKVSGDVHEFFTLSELTSKQRYVINTKGAFLKPGLNKVNIDILYHDDRYKRFTIEEGIIIEMQKPSFGQRIMMYVNRFGLWFDRFINKHEELLEE